MATRSLARRPAQAGNTKKLTEAREQIAASLRDIRAAAAMLRSTLPMTFDGLPDVTNVQDFAAVARSAQALVDTAEQGLCKISIDCKEALPAVYREASAVNTELFHVHDAITCAVLVLDHDLPEPVGTMTESAPGGAFALAASALEACETRLAALLSKIERQIGGAA